jgi:hypothetical protein
MMRQLSFGSKGKRSAYHELFQLDEKYQGMGIAKQALRSSIDMYQRLGMGEVSLYADIDVGGYAWSKYGFLPDVDAWNQLRRNLKSQFANRVKYNTYELDEKLVDAVNAALDSEDPRALRLVASNKLGKELLLGSFWKGTLDLTKTDSLDYFRAYANR